VVQKNYQICTDYFVTFNRSAQNTTKNESVVRMWCFMCSLQTEL